MQVLFRDDARGRPLSAGLLLLPAGPCPTGPVHGPTGATSSTTTSDQTRSSACRATLPRGIGSEPLATFYGTFGDPAGPVDIAVIQVTEIVPPQHYSGSSQALH